MQSFFLAETLKYLWLLFRCGGGGVYPRTWMCSKHIAWALHCPATLHSLTGRAGGRR